MATIGSKLRVIRSAYSRVLAGGYLFNEAEDLTRKFRVVIVWMLLTDDEGRMAIRSLEFRRHAAVDHQVWNYELSQRHLSEKSGQWVDPRFELARQNIAARMSHRHGGAWRVERIIGWAGGKNVVRIADRTAPRRAGSGKKLKRGERE